MSNLSSSISSSLPYGTVKGLIQSINIGLNRNKRVSTIFPQDQGILALPTFIHSPPEDAREKLKDTKETSYILNCGGTNWEALEMEIDGLNVYPKETKATKKFKTPKSRKYKSLDDFVGQMAELLNELLQKTSLQDKKTIKNLAIVLGFPQINRNTNLGVDASLLTEQLSKAWYVNEDDISKKLIGKRLSKILNKNFGISIENIIFGNDAALMMWDITVKLEEDEQLAPIGGVWGSGTNLGLDPSGDAKDLIINTELGQSPSLVTTEDKAVYNMAVEIGCEVTEQPINESFIGGDYLFFNLVAASILNSEKWGIDIPNSLQNYLINITKERGNSHYVSEIAKAQSPRDIEGLFKNKINVSTQVFWLLHQTAQEILDNTARKIAQTLAGCVIVSDLSPKYNWVIPAEGSVIKKGHGILAKIDKYLKDYLPKHTIRLATDGSSKKALAIAAIYNSLSKE